jgi:hypothetical protein
MPRGLRPPSKVWNDHVQDVDALAERLRETDTPINVVDPSVLKRGNVRREST